MLASLNPISWIFHKVENLTAHFFKRYLITKPIFKTFQCVILALPGALPRNEIFELLQVFILWSILSIFFFELVVG